MFEPLCLVRLFYLKKTTINPLVISELLDKLSDILAKLLSSLSSDNIFVKPACGEQDLVLTISDPCMCVCCTCVRPCRFVWAITSTFMHGFQNNLAQLFSLTSRSAIRNICSGRLKVRVTLEGHTLQGQIIKWS